MRIALDIDDVLAGFATGVHEVFNSKITPHDHWSADEQTGILMLKRNVRDEVIGYTQEYLDKCENNEDFWYGLEPISLPVDVPEGTVCYITSSPKNMVETRLAWLAKHGFPNLPVIHSKDKGLTMHRLRINLLVDDKLKTIQEVRKVGLLGAHFKPWYCNLQEDDSIEHLKDLAL